MPGPAIWGGGSSGSGSDSGSNAGNSSTPAENQFSAPSGSPVQQSANAVASAAAVAHDAENCNGGKLARTRRAFREMLLKL